MGNEVIITPKMADLVIRLECLMAMLYAKHKRDNFLMCAGKENLPHDGTGITFEQQLRNGTYKPEWANAPIILSNIKQGINGLTNLYVHTGRSRFASVYLTGIPLKVSGFPNRDIEQDYIQAITMLKTLLTELYGNDIDSGNCQRGV